MHIKLNDLVDFIIYIMILKPVNTAYGVSLSCIAAVFVFPTNQGLIPHIYQTLRQQMYVTYS